MVDREHPIGEQERRVGRRRAVRRLAAGLRLELVAEAADVAEVEVERQPGRQRRGAGAQLLVEIVEERPLDPLPRALALDRHGARREVVGHVLRERPRAISHEGEARQAVDHRARVQPEAMLVRREQLAMHELGIGQHGHSAHVDLVRACGLARGARRPALAAMGECEVAEVREQVAPVLRGDRLGVKLHAPQRLAAVAQAHDDVVLRPGDDLELLGHVLDRERVVADGVEGRGQPLEEPGPGVLHGAQAPVHRLRRVLDRAAEGVADALVPEAHAEQRDSALADRAGADAEVRRPVRPARPRRDDDGVEALGCDRRRVGVVADHHGGLAVDLAQKLVEVVGERVVVVDEERSHRARPTGLLRPWHRGRCHDARPGSAIARSSTRQVSVMMTS